MIRIVKKRKEKLLARIRTVRGRKGNCLASMRNNHPMRMKREKTYPPIKRGRLLKTYQLMRRSGPVTVRMMIYNSWCRPCSPLWRKRVMLTSVVLVCVVLTAVCCVDVCFVGVCCVDVCCVDVCCVDVCCVGVCYVGVCYVGVCCWCVLC